MLIQIISDTHLEFHKDNGKEYLDKLDVIGKVLVVAGDFCTYDILELNLETLIHKFDYVVYVTGNHEYYNSSREVVHEILNKIKVNYPNKFYWLNNSIAEIEGHRFIGCTLWFKPTITNWKLVLPFRLNDFNVIKDYSDWVEEANKESTDYLINNTKDKDIVVTHFAPHPNSNIHWGRSILTDYYVCDMREVMFNNKPSVWIHGHIHEPVLYKEQDTIIISNPVGYAMEGINLENRVIETERSCEDGDTCSR